MADRMGGLVRYRSRPRRTAIRAIAVVFLALAACGDDESEVERERTATGGVTNADTESGVTPRTGTDTTRTLTAHEQTTTAPGVGSPPPAPPEDGPGGAGDEVPSSSQARFTGRGGRIRPPLVRVPPFIAVRVELRSADGRRYALRFGGRLVRADGKVSSSSALFDGLRPGKRLVGRGAAGRVVIEASAEPGP